jgi:FAD:protein FMN transferase
MLRLRHRLIVLLLLSVALIQCKTDPHAEAEVTNFARIKGNTMGTTYTVVYEDAQKVNYKRAIDSLLKAINQEVSTYIPDADISVFNKAAAGVQRVERAENPHFVENILVSNKIFQQTNGSFDPTVMPLVNYWGFGYTAKRPVTSADVGKVDSLRQFVGYNKLNVTEDETGVSLMKEEAGVQLDFSAVAKGYAVDKVGEFLAKKGIKNYLVEIGGETVCRGKSPRQDDWTLGINVPSRKAATTDVQEIVRLQDRALATSGNYRNYHTAEDGSIYAHTINPKTGLPEKNALLSASVIADDCATADAFATAFMVMGKDAALKLAEKLPEVECFLIFADEKGEMQTIYSAGFEKYLVADE